jgi:hypothetical protein
MTLTILTYDKSFVYIYYRLSILLALILPEPEVTNLCRYDRVRPACISAESDQTVGQLTLKFELDIPKTDNGQFQNWQLD